MNELKFGEQEDFQRKEIAEKIIKLLKEDIDVAPIVIDGAWGTGKTQFCQKLINLFSEEDTHHLIYVDAFKADHADEPLLTILSAIFDATNSLEQDEVNIRKKVIPALRFGVKTIAKAGVAHTLRQDTDSLVNSFDKDVKKVADVIIDKVAESILKDHVEAEKNLQVLREYLSKLAQEKSIVIFIDELDRCRPSFSVSMLEVVKHTFDIPNIQFVFITNMNQLKASVNHCYGQEVNAEEYLNKFVKLRFSLPQKFLNMNASVVHAIDLISQSSVLNKTLLREQDFLYMLSFCIEAKNLSLRQTETLIKYIEIYQVLHEELPKVANTPEGKTLFHTSMLAICFYVLSPSQAKPFLESKSDAEVLLNFLDIDISSVKELKQSWENALGVLIGKSCIRSSSSLKQIDCVGEVPLANYLQQVERGRITHAVDKYIVYSHFVKVISKVSLIGTLCSY